MPRPMKRFGVHIVEFKNVVNMVTMRVCDDHVIELLNSIIVPQMTKRAEFMLRREASNPEIHDHVSVIGRTYISGVTVLHIPKYEFKHFKQPPSWTPAMLKMRI